MFFTRAPGEVQRKQEEERAGPIHQLAREGAQRELEEEQPEGQEEGGGEREKALEQGLNQNLVGLPRARRKTS